MKSSKEKTTNQTSEITEKIKRYDKILAFLFGAVAYWLVFSYSQMAGGKYSPLRSDLLDIYVPAIKAFARCVLNRESISNLIGVDFGVNSIPFFATYSSMFSVTTLLFLVFPGVDSQLLILITIIIKAGLSSLSFYCMAKKIKSDSNIFILFIMSLAYALSGYSIAYLSINIIWFDAYYLLPIIIMLVHEYVDHGKWKLIAPLYLYLFLTNYYMGFVVGIFSFLYFLLYDFIVYKNNKLLLIKKVFFFILQAIIAVFASMAVLYPVIMFFTHNLPPDAKSVVDTVTVFDTLNQLFIGMANGIDSGFPYVYSSLFALLLCPIYFIYSKNNKLKIMYLLLIIIVVVSISISPLNMFWHAFNAPDGWNCRFSFLLSFLLCVITIDAFLYIEKINKKYFITISFGILLFLIIMNFTQNSFYGSTNNGLFIILINIVYGLIYMIIIMKLNIVNNKLNYYCILALAIVSEIVGNGCLIINDDVFKPYIYSEELSYEDYSISDSIAKLNDNSLYRINHNNPLIASTGLLYNFNGTGYFGSVEKFNSRKLLDEIGIYTSPSLIQSYGESDFSKMILGVKYDMESPFLDGPTTDYKQKTVITPFDYNLSLGFLVDSSFENISISSNNAFENINKIASSMINENCFLYSPVEEAVTKIEKGITILNDNGSRYVLNEINAEGNGFLLFTVPTDDRQAYAQFDYGTSLNLKEAPILAEGYENIYNIYGRNTVSYIKEMTKYLDCYELTMIMNGTTLNEFPCPNNIYFYYYNKEQMDILYDKLKSGQMNVLEHKNGYIKSEITLDENDADKILFISIPFDEGWSAKVNGEEKELIPLLDNAFIGLKLEPGDNTIELKYNVPGLKTGIIASIIGIFGYIACCVTFEVAKNKHR